MIRGEGRRQRQGAREKERAEVSCTERCLFSQGAAGRAEGFRVALATQKSLGLQEA